MEYKKTISVRKGLWRSNHGMIEYSFPLSTRVRYNWVSYYSRSHRLRHRTKVKLGLGLSPPEIIREPLTNTVIGPLDHLTQFLRFKIVIFPEVVDRLIRKTATSSTWDHFKVRLIFTEVQG